MTMRQKPSGRLTSGEEVIDTEKEVLDKLLHGLIQG
jgi:hypothetical protein